MVGMGAPLFLSIVEELSGLSEKLKEMVGQFRV